MPEASNAVVIARSVGDVFSFLADAENDAKWRKGIVEIARIGGQGVGTTYRQVVNGPGGRRIDADIEISEFVPNERIAFRTTKGPVRPTGSYELRPDGAGTEVTFRLASKLSGLKKLMGPMVQKTMQSEVSALDELKRALEDT